MTGYEQKCASLACGESLLSKGMQNEFSSQLDSPDASCANSLCPLNRIKAGVAVRIKRLCASPQVATRLRELGFCEDQIVRLLTAHSNIICMVCDARLAL